MPTSGIFVPCPPSGSAHGSKSANYFFLTAVGEVLIACKASMSSELEMEACEKILVWISHQDDDSMVSLVSFGNLKMCFNR